MPPGRAQAFQAVLLELTRASEALQQYLLQHDFGATDRDRLAFEIEQLRDEIQSLQGSVDESLAEPANPRDPSHIAVDDLARMNRDLLAAIAAAHPPDVIIGLVHTVIGTGRYALMGGGTSGV